MSDTWAPRGADHYAEVITNELPDGSAWTRDRDGGLMKWVDGNAQIWGDFDARAADLLITEADPRSPLELLPDWERAFGLPDACSIESPTVEDRRNALVNKMTIVGRQDRNFFVQVAAALGYVITITEFSPFMCGISQCGDTSSAAPDNAADTGPRWVFGPPEIRFYWKVHVFGRRLSWFRCGSGQCGLDPMLRIALATDLECVIRRWSPAHTQVIFDYANATASWGEYVWFRCGESQCGEDPMFRTITHDGGATADVV